MVLYGTVFQGKWLREGKKIGFEEARRRRNQVIDAGYDFRDLSPDVEAYLNGESDSLPARDPVGEGVGQA